MPNEKSEKTENVKEPIANVLEIANKVFNESKIPLILWDENDKGKYFIFQFLNLENENLINALLQKGNKTEKVQISIKPKALKTQWLKFIPIENDVFTIKFLGKFVQEEGSGNEYKSFILKKFDLESRTFITTKQIQ